MAGRNTLKKCLDCGRLSYTSRCPRCSKEHEKAYKKRARPDYNYEERKRRKEAVEAYRKIFGDLCPGWGRDPHPVGPGNPLTADHKTPVAGGGQESGELGVLCKSCNSAKGSS